jgi:hypothetical protein
MARLLWTWFTLKAAAEHELLLKKLVSGQLSAEYPLLKCFCLACLHEGKTEMSMG